MLSHMCTTSRSYQSSKEGATLPDGQNLSTLNVVISASAKRYAAGGIIVICGTL